MEKIPVYKTEGIIIKTADLGQLDRLLIIYSRGYGKISARAISARKKESKLRAYLEPFTYFRFLLAKSKTIDIITDVEPIDDFSRLHQNLESLAYAYYFSELIDKLVIAPERDEKIWALVLRAMQVLDKPQSVILSPAKRGEESPANASLSEANAGQEVSHSPASLSRRRGEREILRRYAPQNDDLVKIRLLFELKLLEFLGHGISKNKKPPDIIQGLVGEKIKSAEFLGGI